MTILVNYYTCSYGDSFVNMFNGQPVKRVNDLARCCFDKFIEPVFYDLTYKHRYQDWIDCQKLNLIAVPCHRQNSFDFVKELDESVKIISIILDWDDFLGDRFKSIHLNDRNKFILDSRLKKILDLSPSHYKEIINADYKRWARTNCFNTDIKFNFSWIFDMNKIEEFCLTNNVKFDQDWIIDIRKNLQQYVMS